MRSKFPSRNPHPSRSRKQPPPEVNVTPTDERAFYEKVQRVTAYRGMRGLRIPGRRDREISGKAMPTRPLQR